MDLLDLQYVYSRALYSAIVLCYGSVISVMLFCILLCHVINISTILVNSSVAALLYISTMALSYFY